MFIETMTTTNPAESERTVNKEVSSFMRQFRSFLDKEIDLEKEAVEQLTEAGRIGRVGTLSQNAVIKELKYYLRQEIELKKEALHYLNAKLRRPRTSIRKESIGFMKQLNNCIGGQIMVKTEGDDSPIGYTLREVGRDYVVVEFGHGLRVIQKAKITFFQIGTYAAPLA